MRAKKAAPPRRRISFAVDRDEIEINSDWVEAVMASPAPPPPVTPFPAPAPDALFFAPDANNATGATSASGAECTSVEISSAVAKLSSVETPAAVEHQASAENDSTVEGLDGKSFGFTRQENAPVDNSATVASLSPVAQEAPVEFSTVSAATRTARPRPILRVTDGLTPGQYAVYSLMYEAGEPVDGGAHIYKGGYADLGRLTGLSKRGLQNIIAELQTKQVIRLHQQPGYHRTETSAYMVPAPSAVLERWSANGWRHAFGKSKTLSA